MSQTASSPADRASGRLSRIGTRLRPGAGGFVSWWGQSLAAWLPQGMRRTLGFGRGRLLLQVDGDDLQLRRERADEVRDLGRLPLAGLLGESVGLDDPLASLLTPGLEDLPRWLLLPAASGLRRRMGLPAAAADHLRDVVGFEIDRQTPFAADAVAFDARVLGRRENDGQLDVELVAVPRQVLDPQLVALGPLASSLAGIDMAAADGTALGVNLLPASQRRSQRDPATLWNTALALVAVVAVVALLWQLLDNRRAAATGLEQVIAAQADAGRRAAAQRQQLIRLVDGQVFLDRTRAKRPPTVEVIDELTRRLPDHTYLEKLSISDDQLMLIGLSSKAAALIGQLQGASQWRSPALAGALQPDPGSGRDRFTLTANLAVTTAANPPDAVETADAPAPSAR
ncbi:MAG: PilN domain-containing protein [Lysobacter sp.]